MTHTNCHPELLTLYLQHELNEEQQQWLESHLSGCADCRKQLEQLSSTLRLAATDRLTLSNLERQQFTQRVTAASHSRRRSRLPAWGLALGSAAALGMTLILLQPGNAPQAPQQNKQIFAEIEVLQDMEILDDLDLLEDLDLLQEMEELG